MTEWTSQGVGQYVASEGHIAVMTRLYKPNGTKRGIVYCHGYGQDWSGFQVNSREVYTFAELGFPVISCDLGGQTFGNDTSQTRIGQAWTYLKSTFGAKTDKMILWAGSMGAGAALRYIRANPTTVAGCGVVVPLIDLADVHDNNRLGTAAAIETAYGGLAGYQAALPTVSPAPNAAAHAGLPIEIWRASDDPTCLPALTDSFAATAGLPVHSLGAVGHTSSALVSQPTSLALATAFVSAHA